MYRVPLLCTGCSYQHISLFQLLCTGCSYQHISLFLVLTMLCTVFSNVNQLNLYSTRNHTRIWGTLFQILIRQIFVVRLIHDSVKSPCGLSNVGVMASSEKQRLKHLLVETIHVLCKNSLPDKSSFCIEATIGITLSSDDVMVISFKERVNSDGSHTSLMVTDEQDCDHQQLQPSKKTSDETENHRSRSSCSAGNNNNVPVVNHWVNHAVVTRPPPRLLTGGGGVMFLGA